jgi:acrylyl-CoA reductase (NADPH)
LPHPPRGDDHFAPDRLTEHWLVALLGTFTLRQAMPIVTAGFTAMPCVLALEEHGIVPGDGEIVVTGASGGVGAVAIAVFAKPGTGSSPPPGGRRKAPTCAGSARARSSTAELSEPGRALGKERWAGAVDTVGGQTLANVCSTTRYGGTVTACGNTGGMDLPATVAPFVLRVVTLAGIDSVRTPCDRRLNACQRLSADLDLTLLYALTETIRLSDVIDAAQRVVDGRVRGRLVVDTTAKG